MTNWGRDEDYARMKDAELLARARLEEGTQEPRHEWRQHNRVELVIGGAIAALVCAFLALLIIGTLFG